MRGIVRGLLLGAATGVVLGALVRGLMRLVAIGMGSEPAFHLGASIGIVSLFLLACAGAATARAVDLRRAWKALILVVTSAPLLLMGAMFTVVEVSEVRDRDLHPLWTIELLILSTVIVAITLATPLAGWRVGRPARSRR